MNPDVKIGIFMVSTIIGIGMVTIISLLLGGNQAEAMELCRNEGFDRLEGSTITSVYCSKVINFDPSGECKDCIKMKVHATYIKANGSWQWINTLQEGFSGQSTHLIDLDDKRFGWYL